MATPGRRVFHSSHWGAFQAEVKDGRVVATHPFAKDPDPSPIAASLPGAVDHATRIRQPMVRKGWLEGRVRSGRGAEPFVPVSWDRALDLVGDELLRVRHEHGNEAIFAGSYGWASAGRLHHAPTLLHRLLNLLGGFTFSVNSYSNACGEVILPHVVGRGQPSSSWPAIAAHGELVVAFGGLALKNSQVQSGGCGEHTVATGLRAARAAGVRFVCITPLLDDAADFLDAQVLMARPNTDVAIMLGLAHTLVAEDLHDRAFLSRYCVGFERFLPYLMGEADGQPKDACWAAGVSGLDAERIRELARRMARCRTLVTCSLSTQRQDHGEQAYWMAITLAAMLGQLGLPGGGFGAGYAAVNGVGNPNLRIRVPRLGAGRNPVRSFIPSSRISDLLLEPGRTIDYDGRRLRFPDIRLVYWCGGNPFHHHQDLNRLLRAWQRPETIVVHEIWWTASARHADVVLPATTTLERNDLGANVEDRFLIAMQQAIPPVGQARNDYDILADLAGRLGVGKEFSEERGEMDWLRHLYAATVEEGAPRRGAARLRPLLGRRVVRAPARAHAHRDARSLPGGSRGEPAAHAVGPGGDLLRGDRRLRLRRLPGAPGLDPPGGVARRTAGRAPSAPPDGDPARDASPRPARLRRGKPGLQGGRAGADPDPPRRRRRARHLGRRRGACLQRPRRLPGGRRALRAHPPERGAAGDRSLVRPAGARSRRRAVRARQPEPADPRRRQLEARAGPHRAQRPGRDRALGRRAAPDPRVRAAPHGLSPPLYPSRREDAMEGEKLTTRRLNDMGLAFMHAGTLLAAIELGLFDALADGPLSPTEVGRRLGLDEERAEKLITACAALDLVERSGGRVANVADVDRFLVRGKPTYFGGYLLHFGKGSFSGWGRVAEHLLSEERSERRYYDLTQDAAEARSLTEAGYTGSQGTARRMARRFDFSPYHHLLDLGGGSGVYSIEACRASPELRATVFDAPNVCVVTRELVEKAALTDRIDAVGGDFTRDPLPAGADVVLLCGNLHAYDSETARRVVRKAYDVLPSGGGMILCDYMIDAGRTGPPVSAFLSVSLSFRGGSGKVHDANEFRAYLEEAGFRVDKVEEFVPGSLGWATATKP